jgi:hypothetical protein
MRYLAVMLAALSTALPAAAAPPSRVELTFAIMMGELRIAEAREVLEHDGRRYHVVSESTPKGIAALFINDIRRESRGTVTAAGLRPEHFEETGRKGGTRVAKFDWAAGELTLVNSHTTRTVALPQGTLDQASLAYALAFRSAVNAGFNVHVTDGRGVKQYRYREIGAETLKTPLGELRTRHFEKVRDPGDKRGFEFWLATDRDLLPVKLRYLEKNGDVFDSNITAFTSR